MPPITLYTDKARLSRVTALRGIDASAMDDQIARQSGVMNGYFRARFTLPFTFVGDDVIDKCTALVAFNLLADRGFNPNRNALIPYSLAQRGFNLNQGNGDDAITLRYKDALQWLQDVRDNKITPDVTDSA